MARILVNMPSQYGGKPSGVARVAFSLLERLIAIGGHEYILRSAWSREQLPAALQTLELLSVDRPRIMLANVLRQTVTMARICNRARVDLVWNVDGFGASRGGRARVTTVHDLFYRHVDSLGLRSRVTMALCYSLVLRGSTRIVTISETTRAELAEAFPDVAGRAIVIGNDTTLAMPAVGEEMPREVSDRYVLMVGNATPNKNFGVVIAALSQLQSEGRAPVLVHVGMDDIGMIAAAMSAADPEPRLIRFSGLDDSRLAALYAHADCLVAPSLSEGFCLPIVEAQALGCPVVASDRSVLPEVGGKGALYFDATDPQALAAQLSALANDTAARTALIARGAKNRTFFSWDASANAYAALFRELAA